MSETGNAGKVGKRQEKRVNALMVLEKSCTGPIDEKKRRGAISLWETEGIGRRMTTDGGEDYLKV